MLIRRPGARGMISMRTVNEPGTALPAYAAVQSRGACSKRPHLPTTFRKDTAMAAIPAPLPDATKDALIAVMEELAAILDPVADGPLPASVRQALAAPLERARTLAAALDAESGPTSAYQMTLDAIEQRIVGAANG